MTSIEWPSARRTIAFFTSDWVPRGPRKNFVLPLRIKRVDALDLDVEQLSTAALICGLVASRCTLEGDAVQFGRDRRLLGDHRRHDDVVVRKSVAHLKRASRASTAARVRTSFSRRRMS